MALYNVIADSFVNGSYVVAGSVIEYDPPEGTEIADNLEAVVVDGKKGRTAPAPTDA